MNTAFISIVNTTSVYNYSNYLNVVCKGEMVDGDDALSFSTYSQLSKI